MKKIQFNSTFSRNVFIPGITLLLLLSFVCALFPQQTESALVSIQKSIYQNLHWLYSLLVTFFLIFQLVLAFSKMGNIRLGADSSEPQYSFLSWMAMLFAAGMGIGLMYYGVAEPISHYVQPALPEATHNPAKEAQLATFFHWGLHAWGIFGIMGLILAYFSFRYKLPLAVRSGLYPILRDRINGHIGDVVDVFTLVCTFFGIATSLSLGVVQLNAGLEHLGILKERSLMLQSVIIVIVTAAAITSALAGMNKGVKRLSELNLLMTVLLVVFILVLGPTTFLIGAFSEGIGNYINHFADLSFNTFAFEKDGHTWFTNWTIMYWAWWISWAPFVGLFIARISKGRTIREYILAVLFVPSLFIFLWMTVFGNGAIWIDQNEAAGSLSALAGNADVLLFAFLEQFPLSKPLCIMAIIMVVVFFVTSADSGILVMNSIASDVKTNMPKWQNAFWGVLLAVISIALLSAGGIKSLQTMTLITALPFGLIMIVLCFCLFKALHTDELCRSSSIPYGSRSWDGRHWQDRLQQILKFSQKQDIQRFFSDKIRPAFENLKIELAKNDINAHIVEGRYGKFSIELNIPYDQILNFCYGVVAEKRTVSDYLIEEDNIPDVETGYQYVPVTYFSDGRAGNDIQYLSRDEIIADVLREYERYLSIISDDEKSMIFLDKKGK
ncbi:MAG: BCCT family transporter [Paludibacteraceae bacterium]|nr:BCCT family transporter [Paludibacteraceae bacterium]